MYDVRRVAVLGAGTMGARIAAHIANAGLPVLLLDIVPASGERNSIAAGALEALKKAKPAAFADASFASHIRIGNFEDDLAKLKDCDWVIEAVAENMEIKRSLLSKVAGHLRGGCDPDDEYQRAAGGEGCGGVAGGFAAALVWDAFFQSAAVHAAVRDDCDAGDRSEGYCGDCGVCG